MGQRPFKELKMRKRLAVLYRDTQRLRWLVEQDMGEVTDFEWLTAVAEMPRHAKKSIKARRKQKQEPERDFPLPLTY